MSGETGNNAKSALIVLSLNSGSSSLKFGVYRVDARHAEPLISGEAESIGEQASAFHATDSSGVLLLHESTPHADARQAMTRIKQLLADRKIPPPQSIGHRIVHGGPHLRQHCRIDKAVQKKLESAAIFAPLHMPTILSVMQLARAEYPDLPQIACFDTAFHSHMPPIATVLPIPSFLRAQGIQRYGFHGLSCESIVRQLQSNLPSRLIIAHLGNGASVTAVHKGVSIDTSMGLTPSGGIIMGTRSGDLDPGVLVYLAREEKLDAAMIEDLIDQHSGLLGISGTSEDMRELHKEVHTNLDAHLAIDMFCYSASKEIAAMSAILGGAESSVFTGGIGERDAVVRTGICGRLSSIGVLLDEVRNRESSAIVSDPTSRCSVQVLPSLEDVEIAHQTWALCGGHPHSMQFHRSAACLVSGPRDRRMP
jgi:acetate kinase